ncbi:Serpin-ZX [Bienertia sinuspersici]
MEFCMDVSLYKLQEKAKKSSEENENPENVAISPFGMCVILNMIANVAEGATLDQLLQFLKLQSIDELVPHANKLMQIAKSSKRNENPIFVENVFNAKVKSVDFLHKDAVAEVNAWAEIETKGCINQLIPYKNFNKLTMLVRANGLYFSGMWANEFIESNTENENFT